ncbi:hypothetical protein D3C85_1351550 [compost metagenome]
MPVAWFTCAVIPVGINKGVYIAPRPVTGMFKRYGLLDWRIDLEVLAIGIRQTLPMPKQRAVSGSGTYPQYRR